MGVVKFKTRCNTEGNITFVTAISCCFSLFFLSRHGSRIVAVFHLG